MADETFSRLSLPMQAAPVYRGPSYAALSGSGVEPSDWLDDILGGVQKVGQVAGTIGQVAGPILGALSSFGI
jgi:hypothetical protein